MIKRTKRYDWLVDRVNEKGYTKGAELGAATGNTTSRLLAQCPTLEKLIIADIWKPVDSPQWNMDNMEEIFRKKFQGDKRVGILKGNSWEMAQYVQDESLDFVFIDADHSYECVKKDIEAWLLKIKEGGLLCGHDINLEGVKKAVDEYLPKWIDSKVDHIWYTYL